MDMQPSPDPFGVTSLDALEALYEAPSELVRNKVGARIDAATARFIAASPLDRKSTRLNSSHSTLSRMPSSA